jgi:hypothetical protein
MEGQSARDLDILGRISEIVVAVATIGGLVVAAVLLGLHHKPFAAWTFVVVAALAVVLVGAAYLLGRRHRPGVSPVARELKTELEAAQADAERALTEVTVATSYLSSIDDFMSGIREAFAIAPDWASAKARLERVRPVIFDAVIQGINSTRDEHIRCVFFKPHQTEEGVVLRPEHHHGHSTDVEKLELWADERSAAGRAFATGEAIYIEENARTNKQVQDVPQQKPMESLLCLPAFGPTPQPTSGTTAVVGVFSVDSTRKRAFALSDREFASVCASMLGLVDYMFGIFQRGIEIETGIEGGAAETRKSLSSPRAANGETASAADSDAP